LTANRKQIRVLAVSSEPSLLRALWSTEKSNLWHIETAASGWDAMERVQSALAPRLIVLDLPQGDMSSLHFLRWLRRTKTDLPVVLLCYADDAVHLKEAARIGASEILERPFDAKKLEVAIRRQLAGAGESEAKIDGHHIEPLGQDVFFVSASLIMQKLRAQAALMAKTDAPVLILGEPGAGKYTVASLIHKLSVRSGFKLLRLNCAETPESVLEAELFGIEGSAHGAGGRGSSGRFFAGERGTIFLSEITAMPSALQEKLLHLLRSDEFAGSTGSDSIADVRILASSSESLDRALEEKRLREDLYYRLSAFTVQVPPLRQRKDETPILLRYFMHKLAKYYSLPPRGFSPSLLDACQGYSWPGNLKEMETVVKRYLVAGEEDLSFDKMGWSDAIDNVPQASGWREMPPEGVVPRGKDSQPESLKSLIQSIKSEAEQNAIGAALKKTGWNRKAAARLLRVSYRTLLYKIDQYHMRAPENFLSSVAAGEFSVYDEVKGNGKAS
jgi:two-component system, NtrC family, response regulator AtoC